MRLVELAGMTDALLVGPVVGAELLATAHVLLVLDNCEHVVDACARIAADLLQTCPHLRILATSREPLGIPGEQVWRVPSLTEAQAVQLFVERARAVRPEFTLGEATTTAITTICRRVDGIPLAIELAAARYERLSIEDLAARLETDLALARGVRAQQSGDTRRFEQRSSGVMTCSPDPEQ